MEEEVFRLGGGRRLLGGEEEGSRRAVSLTFPPSVSHASQAPFATLYSQQHCILRCVFLFCGRACLRQSRWTSNQHAHRSLLAAHRCSLRAPSQDKDFPRRRRWRGESGRPGVDTSWVATGVYTSWVAGWQQAFCWVAGWQRALIPAGRWQRHMSHTTRELMARRTFVTDSASDTNTKSFCRALTVSYWFYLSSGTVSGPGTEVWDQSAGDLDDPSVPDFRSAMAGSLRQSAPARGRKNKRGIVLMQF